MEMSGEENEDKDSVLLDRKIDSINSLSLTQSRFLVAVRNAEKNRVFLLSSSHAETERSTTYLATSPDMRKLHGSRVDFVYSTCLQTNLQMTTLSGSLGDLVHRSSSVRGLIFLSHPSGPGRFTICNPSTGQVITLPDIEAASSSSSRAREGIFMYLGYDPVGDEYKVFCSTAFHGERYQDHKVLTLGGGGGGGDLSWRDIKGETPHCFNVVTNGICISGVVYYVGEALEGEKKAKVFCFDVRSERMRYFIPLSQAISRVSLINYNGKLGVAYHLSDEPLLYSDILVLDLDEVQWLRKSISFSTLLPELSGRVRLQILGVNQNSEIILGPVKLPRKHEPFYIFYYNKGDLLLRKELIRRVKLEGFEEFGCNHTGDDKCVCQLFISPEHLI